MNKAFIVIACILILTLSVNAKYTMPGDERDTNFTEYRATDEIAETPTSYSTTPETPNLYSINWVFPSNNNILFTSDGNITIVADEKRSLITLGLRSDINFSIVNVADLNGGDANFSNLGISGDQHNLGNFFAPFLQIGFDGPTGFPNICSDTIISFKDATKTFSIQPSGASFDVFHSGTRFIKTGIETIVITDEEGAHYIYYDDTGTLQENATPSRTELNDIIKDEAEIAALYWNTVADANIYFTGTNECHSGKISGATHANLHFTRGTLFETGLAVGDITADDTGNNDLHAQLSVSSGTIRDEDILQSITDGAPQPLALPAELPIFYRDGVSNWRKIVTTDFPVTITGTGRAAWNEFAGGVWQLSEVDNTKFVLSHIFTTNNFYEPVVVIVGQATYANQTTAREGAATEINNLITSGLGFQEFVPIATVIFQTNNGYGNTVKSRIRTTDTGDDYIDWRFTQLSPTTSPLEHENLAGLANELAHPQYVSDSGDWMTGDLNGSFDLNFLNAYFRNDLNVAGDANFFNIEADNFYGDGSGLTGIVASSDVNGADIRPQNVSIDNNLMVRGDANFIDIGITGNFFGTNTLIAGIDKLQCDDCVASGNDSIALGWDTTASGLRSTAMGGDTTASGNYSTAMGWDTTASTIGSTAMGVTTTANGNYSTAMGGTTTASGNYSTATGRNTQAGGDSSFAGGRLSTTSGVRDFAFGYTATTSASGDSIALGPFATTSAYAGVAIGNLAWSGGEGSIALGNQGKATGEYSIAIGSGSGTLAEGRGSVAIGFAQDTNGISSLGQYAIAIGSGRDSGGELPLVADGNNTIAIGRSAQARAFGAMSIGYRIINSDINTLAIGPDVNISNDLNVGDNLEVLGTTYIGEDLTVEGDLNVQGSINDKSLIGHWRLDETTADYSGNEYDATAIAGMAVTDGVAVMSTQGKYMNVDAYATEFADLDEGTIGFWFNITRTSEDQPFIAFRDKSEGNSYLLIGLEAGDGKIHIDVIEAGGAILEWASTASYDDYGWIHVIYSSNSTGNSIEINGVTDAGAYATGNAGTQAFIANVNDVDGFLIGYNEMTALGNYAEMDNIKVYNRRLTFTERLKLYDRDGKNAYVNTLRSGLTGIGTSPNSLYSLYVFEWEQGVGNTRDGIFSYTRSATADTNSIHARANGDDSAIAGLFEIEGSPSENAKAIYATQNGSMFAGTLYGVYMDIKASGGATAWNLYANSVADNYLGWDSAKSYYGTAKDASIEYDGTNFVINPDEVGSGMTVNDGDLNVLGDFNYSGQGTSMVQIEWRDYSTFVDNGWISRNLLEADNNGSFTPMWNGSVVGLSSNITQIGKDCVTPPEQHVYINGVDTTFYTTQPLISNNDYNTIDRGFIKFKAGDEIKLFANNWTCTSTPMHGTFTLALVYN